MRDTQIKQRHGQNREIYKDNQKTQQHPKKHQRVFVNDVSMEGVNILRAPGHKVQGKSVTK